MPHGTKDFVKKLTESKSAQAKPPIARTGSRGAGLTCYNQRFPMAEILPFQAIRYNLDRVAPSEVVTQPYDKISPAMQDRYYDANPYNLVRIILGRREAEDSSNRNVYTRAAGFGKQWLAHGILQQDPQPSLYAYSQDFTAPSGKRFERRGFIGLGRVEDYSAEVVFRHEQTLAKPKADRLDLLRATRAHYEQLFLLYEDEGEIDSVLDPARKKSPTIDVTDEYGVAHRVWQVAEAHVIGAVQRKMSTQKLVIADGHHRYETALNFRDECRKAAGTNCDPRARHEFVMMTFVNMNDPGLLILPTHRVVHSLPSFRVDNFLTAAEKFFSIEELEPGFAPSRATEMLGERGNRVTALVAVTMKRAFLLHSAKAAAPSRMAGFSTRQQKLDVVQLHKVLLEGVLSLTPESIRDQQNLSYIREAAEALAQVRKGSADIAFLMNPCKVQQVRDIALAGEVMPQKSTDFYPKLLSGLTAYALD
jgi:uncharacterized protein (DUF1015 family)